MEQYNRRQTDCAISYNKKKRVLLRAYKKVKMCRSYLLTATLY